MQGGTLPKMLKQMRSITFKRIAFNIVEGHHLQLRCHSPLFCNFKWPNIKAAVAHHPIIQKVVHKLLSKGSTEPSTGGVGFYSNVFCCSLVY